MQYWSYAFHNVGEIADSPGKRYGKAGVLAVVVPVASLILLSMLLAYLSIAGVVSGQLLQWVAFFVMLFFVIGVVVYAFRKSVKREIQKYMFIRTRDGSMYLLDLGGITLRKYALSKGMPLNKARAGAGKGAGAGVYPVSAAQFGVWLNALAEYQVIEQLMREEYFLQYVDKLEVVRAMRPARAGYTYISARVRQPGGGLFNRYIRLPNNFPDAEGLLRQLDRFLEK